jgi:Flp pilus assembly protein TadG
MSEGKTMKVQKDEHGQTGVLPRGLNRAAGASRTSVKAQSIDGWLRASFRCGDEGQSLLEMAFVLPVLLMLVMGLFWLGLWIAYYQALTQAVGAGGQVLAHDRGNSTNPCADALAAMQAASPLYLNPANITVTVSLNGTSLGGSNNSCPGNALSDLGTAGGGTVQVRATYTYTCKIPWSTTVCSSLYAQVTEYVY